MIKTKINNVWQAANDNYIVLFNTYIDENTMYREIPYSEDDITIFRDNNDPYNGIYIQTSSNNKYPICNWDDVKVFLTDMNPVDWYSARNYQVWAFYDFMYDNKPSKRYISRGSSVGSDDTIIDIANLAPGIVFTIGRNANNSVYYERNDLYNTKVRICDNEWARIGYRGFYTRITMDPGIIITPPPSIIDNKINLPNDVSLLSTENENEQCIMCATYKSNLLFKPCNHSISCSECYKKLNNNLCPLCKTSITGIDII